MVPTSHHALLWVVRTVLVDCVYSFIGTATAVCEITAPDHILQTCSQTDGSFVSVCLVYPENHGIVDRIERWRSQAHWVSTVSVSPYYTCLRVRERKKRTLPSILTELIEEIFRFGEWNLIPRISQTLQLSLTVLLNLFNLFLENCETGIHNGLRLVSRPECDVLKVFYHLYQLRYSLRSKVCFDVLNQQLMWIHCKRMEYFGEILLKPIFAFTNESNQLILDCLQPLS